MEPSRKAVNLLPDFSGEAWQSWVPRPELAPVFDKRFDGDRTQLCISGEGRFEAYGAWWCEISGIEGGAAYNLMAAYGSEGTGSHAVSINMIVTWMDNNRNWLRREYVDDYAVREDGLSELNKTVQAPSGAHAAKVELEYRWSAAGKVFWQKAAITAGQMAQRKKVKIVTTYISPNTENRHQLSDNLQCMLDTIERAGELQPDLICFSETMYDRCSGYPPTEVAQAIPGELTQAIGGKAKQVRSYVVFNMHEREGGCVYNTSILFDRNGDIAGKYRKTHLPLFEAQDGITPGNDYPVFDTDFGKVGLLVCWDISFPEPARLLRLKGAEIVCLSTAGEGRAQQIARAVDNGLYLVVSGINGAIIVDGNGESMSDPASKPSRIINPAGEVLEEIGRHDNGIACAEIDLNRRFEEFWMSVGPAYGEARSLFGRERRPDTYAMLAQSQATNE
ncbi:carbon-nitrogen hydrolase family protein [Paenibacillus rhizovicinus]|uniref:Carbon-nitrogen hydrolase family protein n=1 Tax=Paenibacillus rhizovicinus TaxID=2704463 RepID=A0A6C0NUR1_9BACL|nr:carbon-nitrogen hydrolase family protein [Paenibacillus rhizovicinus]QHW29927.1 carbon-nitrogen hydrolase family protein [Paenibacillus rhizovicinus]